MGAQEVILQFCELTQGTGDRTVAEGHQAGHGCRRGPWRRTAEESEDKVATSQIHRGPSVKASPES